MPSGKQPTAAHAATEINLAGATVVLPADPHETVRLAATELVRYLYVLTGSLSRLDTELPKTGTALVLDPRRARELGITVEPAKLGRQGYRIAAMRRHRLHGVVLTAVEPVGILYAVYALLERLGMGFYAGGDTFPEHPGPATVPADLDLCRRPHFEVRGNMLHYNFLCGVTCWGLDDYKFYFDQLARMRCNMLLMHWYDDEPGAACEVDGEYLNGGKTPNALAKPWGARAALRTSQYSFGSGRFFDTDVFTSPAAEDMPDLVTEIRRSEQMFRAATRYARTAGIGIAAGFQAPSGDPTDPALRERLRTRMCQFLENYPDLTHFALWQHEGGACLGTRPPKPGSKAARLLDRRRDFFRHLGTEWRVWEAVRYGAFAELAADILAREAPHLRLVLIGWGGDRWMRFADLCLGYDKTMPPDVILSCHDNIDASFGPGVSQAWGELPPERERWAIPWVEGDEEDCWVRQPNVESLGTLAPDALRKGAQGLLTLQWRTRDTEEETAYAAQFAWDPKLTPRRFYHDLARRAFGADHETDMGRTLGTLQRLGARWTGVRGCPECSLMVWTGMTPHVPFDVNADACTYLLRLVETAATTFARVPDPAEQQGTGAFHERDDNGGAAAVAEDRSRAGVRELENVAGRLRQLRTGADTKQLRAAFAAIEEELWDLRAPLVVAGMTRACYQALDIVLILMHHLQRNAGASRHMRRLRTIRRELERLRREYVDAGRIARLERLTYLTATLDFALHFDAAVMLLASGETVDQALARAAALQQRGNEDVAARVAAGAYAALVRAGMEHAVAAMTRKLTTRCDFGTLTTVNVKPLPLYWETLEQLEAFLPAAPPRELQARGGMDAVQLSWPRPPRRVAGLNLHRRPAGTAPWTRVNRKPLRGGCIMFVDRTAPTPGEYEYALSALAANGWESPRSHAVRAAFGALTAGPRIVAAKPYSRHTAGTDLRIRIAALSDRGIAGVRVAYRNAGAVRWQAESLQQRFRYGYAGAIPGAKIRPGVLEFRVEAEDAEGNRSFWPAAAAAGEPWTVTVLPDPA